MAIRTQIMLALAAMALLGSCTPKEREIIQLPDGTSYTVTYHMQGDSIKTGLYEDGSVYYKSQKYKGFGSFTESESFTYYPNGQVRKYAYFLNDSLRYFRFYNKQGQPTETGGCALVYLDNEVQFTDTINRHEPYFQQLKLALPPQAKIRILYGNEVPNEEERNMDTDPLDFLPVKGNISGMLVKLDLPGTYDKVLYWSLEDTVHGGIEKGRIWRQFIVEDK